MSAQVIRCIRILSVLSGGQRLTTNEIITCVTDQDSPAVTRRQIQRDLQSIERAGVPLASERVGRELRWYIPTSYRGLQPLAITSQEMLSLHMLKGALGAFRHTRIQNDVERLQRRLERVVPGTVFLRQDVVCEVSPGRYTSAIDDAVMERIIFAITDPHWDRVTYRSIHSGETKTFVVSFCRMINHAGRLYVAAWHPKHSQYITLAVDRIDHVERADDVNLPHHVFDERKYTRARFGVYDGEVESIVLRIDASAAEYFASRTWHPSQRIKKHAKGSLELALEAPLSPELVSWIVSWSDVISIVSPRKLKTICRDKVRRLFETKAP